MKTSRPKLILNRKARQEDARAKDKFSSEILLEESRPCLVRVKRIKNAFENTEELCISSNDEDLPTPPVSLEFENSNSTVADEKKGKKLLELSSTDMNISNTNRSIDKEEALLEKVHPCGVSSVTLKKSVIKKIFPLESGVNDDVILHSAFRDMKVDQVKNTRATGASEKHFNKLGFETRYKGENGGNRNKKSKTIKNSEVTLSEYSDDICDFVDEYQNLDMLFGEA